MDSKENATETTPNYYPPPPPGQYPPPPAGQPPYPVAGPPQYPPPVVGQVQYVQPVDGYPPQQGYVIAPQYGAQPPQQPLQQQQQQQVVVVNSQQQQPVVVQQVQSFVGHIVFACFVFWCCSNWLFGLIAFILAVVASSTVVSDPAGARRLGHASIGVSIAGIVVSIIIVIAVVAYVTSSAYKYASASTCAYTINGSCYSYRSYVSTYDTCYGTRSGSYCYCKYYYNCNSYF